MVLMSMKLLIYGYIRILTTKKDSVLGKVVQELKGYVAAYSYVVTHFTG